MNNLKSGWFSGKKKGWHKSQPDDDYLAEIGEVVWFLIKNAYWWVPTVLFLYSLYEMIRDLSKLFK